MKFQLGRLVATAGVHANEPMEDILTAVNRHAHGDWGTLDQEDKDLNDAAVKNGDRILSAYILPSGNKVWVITEADRSVTTCLYPSEY